MPVLEYDGDIFTAPITTLIHQANLFCCMGGGIAREIAKRFPEAVKADNETVRGDTDKLGTFSIAKINKGHIEYIINLYSQLTLYGTAYKNTSYDAMYDGLCNIRKYFDNTQGVVLGVPYGIGCGLGGGSWKIVRAIIDDVFEDSYIPLKICKK